MQQAGKLSQLALRAQMRAPSSKLFLTQASRMTYMSQFSYLSLPRQQVFQSHLRQFSSNNDKEPEKKDDEQGSGRKVPTGFEKLLKRSKQQKDKKESKNEPKEEQAEEESEPKEESKSKGTSGGAFDSFKEKFQGAFGGGNNNMPPESNYYAAAIGITAGLGLAYYAYQNQNQSQEITYMDFVHNYLAKNEVAMITLSEDKSNANFKYRATIDTKSDTKVHLVLPQIENFLYKLDLAQREMGRDPASFVPVKYGPALEGQQTPMVNILVGGSFIILLALLFKNIHTGGKKGGLGKGKTGGQQGKGPGGFGGGGMNDLMGMSKANAQVFGVDKKMRTRFKHVAGMQNAKVEVLEFVDFLKNPEKYKKLGAKIPKGALLAGPPGTGKTLLAKAVAGEAGVPMLTISGSDFVQMYVGVGASRVRDLFKQAKQMSPAIIFIDEIDAVAKKRDQKFSSNDERDNTLNQLLVEMDGFSTDEAVVVMAATNMVDTLDPAIKRPGRFDRQIEITLPTIDERKEIYNVHLKKIKVNSERTRNDYAAKLAALTPGMSGADIANVCNEGAIIAARDDSKDVDLKKFEQATERVIGGLEKKAIMTKEERRTVAYHEAGHAVAGWFLQHANPLLKITIIPRSKGALGFAQYLPEEISLYTKEALLDMIKVSLGGRIAEKIFFGKVTTGASDDIRKVTQIASGLVSVYGMSSGLGLVSYQSQDGPKPYSETTNKKIDMEIRRIVDQQFAECEALLESKKEQIEQLAERLLEKESVNLPQIIDVLGERPFPMKESLKEYLSEVKARDEADRIQKEKEEAEAAAKAMEQEDQAKEMKTDASEEVNGAETPSETLEQQESKNDDKKDDQTPK